MDHQAYPYMKLDEDDILEIVLEHFQSTIFKSAIHSKGIILGQPGKNLRMVCVFSDEENYEYSAVDLNTIDKKVDFNGDHSFIKANPKFNLSREPKG